MKHQLVARPKLWMDSCMDLQTDYETTNVITV